MVRGYLWTSGVEEMKAMLVPVERFLSRRDDEPPEVHRRRLERVQSFAARGFRRWNQGRGEVYLLRDGVVVRGAEDSELDWGRTFAGIKEGVQIVEHSGERWQVLSRSLQDREYDQIVAVRRWSPFLRIVNRLVGYQILIMTLVLALAAVAVRVLVKKIVGPLEELRAWSERIGEAKMEELNRSHITEVSSLQASFTRMGHRVEGALEAHRRFVADASHELKTPLTAISGMLELVEARPEMSENDRQQALSVAKAEAARMGTLISDLLVLSRAQARRSGQRELRRLAPLIEEQLTTLRVLFPQQQFQVDLDQEATWKVNPDAFARIVRNLVENAAKHAGGQPIDVSLLQTDSEDLSLTVRDRGPGIASEKLPELFQRFTRVDEGRSREQGGFGLGLAIVKALVEEVGGELSCRSDLGEGTCFVVRLRNLKQSGSNASANSGKLSL